MKKKIFAIVIMFVLSGIIFTGCRNDKEIKETKPKQNAKTEAEEYKIPENSWNLTVEDAEKYPEGTTFLAPPLDADGNYPEDFDPDEYDGAFVWEEEIEDKETDKKSKEAKENKKDSDKEKISEKKEDLNKD